MKMTYSWIIYSWLIFGSGILCDGSILRRSLMDAADRPVNIEETFNCSNGEFIEKSRVCDGRKDCLDGSDETKELCARNENGTHNMTTDCGRVYINQGQIKNGQIAPVGTAPWNAVVYNRYNEKKSEYIAICGGSIISSNLVVSVAHCFWKPDMSTNGTIKNDGQYKIAVGKYDRNISIIDNIFTQIMDVDIVYLKDSYHGSSGFFAEDIAIVVLKNRISFSNTVAPVCIDWNAKYNEVNGDQGKIVGFGFPNNGSSSPTLLELSLPYMNHTSCWNMFSNGFQVYITADKFCAGSALVSGEGAVRRGYGGAGLSFLHDNSDYLSGVMSLKDPESNNSIATFTEVKRHIYWIRELYNKYK